MQANEYTQVSLKPPSVIRQKTATYSQASAVLRTLSPRTRSRRPSDQGQCCPRRGTRLVRTNAKVAQTPLSRPSGESVLGPRQACHHVTGSSKPWESTLARAVLALLSSSSQRSFSRASRLSLHRHAWTMAPRVRRPATAATTTRTAFQPR